jgi:hypothetical protein
VSVSSRVFRAQPGPVGTLIADGSVFGGQVTEYLANEDLQVIFERKLEFVGEARNQLGKR